MANNFTVELQFDKAKLLRKFESGSEKGLSVVGNEALKDANYHCREDTGELIRSGIRASKPDEGELIWETPYAKSMYYVGTPSKDVNPNATTMWAHKGYTENKDKYLEMMEKAGKEAINGV